PSPPAPACWCPAPTAGSGSRGPSGPRPPRPRGRHPAGCVRAAPRSDLPAQTCGSFVLPAPLAGTPRTPGPACPAPGPAGPHRPELTGQNSPTQELLQARRQLEVAQVGRLVLLRADAERRAGRRRRGARRTATERTLHRLALLLGPLRRVARLALLRLLR